MASSASASEQEMASTEPEIASSSSSEDESLALLKGRFFDEICKELKPKRNVIETRAISKNQVDELMMILRNKTKPRYYYFKDRYRISESQPPELIAIVKAGENGEEGRDLVVVCLEDMWDACMHARTKLVGCGGRSLMVPQAALLFANITRRIIEIFLT